MVNKETLESIFGSFLKDASLEAELTESLGDDFLVGCGVNNSSSEDLFSVFDEEELEEVYDSDLFAGISKKVDNVRNLFIESKKEILNRFDYLKLKSIEFGNRPIRISDLVIDLGDEDVISFLEQNLDNHYVIKNIAKLRAFMDMGFYEVSFISKDGCPICNSFSGMKFDVRYLNDLFLSGKELTHENCDCDFIPVIDRKRYSGNLTINKNLTIGGIEVENFPVEFSGYLEDKIKSLKEVCYVCFVDSDFFNKDKGNVVSKLEGNKFFIDSSYIGFYSAIDYLQEWMYEPVQDTKPQVINPDDLIGEPFLWNGREVIEYKGKFIDILTDTEIDELEEIYKDLEEI